MKTVLENLFSQLVIELKRLTKACFVVFVSALFAACSTSDSSHDEAQASSSYATIKVSLPAANTSEKIATMLKKFKAINSNQIPDEVDQIVIEVLSSDDEILGSGDILASGGELSLQIIAGDNYTVRGSAYADQELLFLGTTLVERIAEGEQTTVALSLVEQVILSLEDLSDQNIGGAAVDLENSLEGLSNVAIEWSVNGVVGGNDVFGTITENGRYTPPLVLPELTTVILTATPSAAPSFAQSVSFELLPPGNQAPQADAGADQTVDAGSVVSLDASASVDSDGTITTYSWSLVSGDFTPSLSDESSSTPTFSAPSLSSGGSVTLRITVTDDDGAQDSDTLIINVNPANIAPVAVAGSDQTVTAGTTVTLDGSASSDSDGNITIFQWSFVSGGANPTISNSMSPMASFTAPDLQYGGSATYRLTVTDDDGDSNSDEIVINFSATDQPVVASAGLNQIVTEGDVVNLDATGSSDPDNVISSYSWVQNSGTSVSLSNGNTATPSFTSPDVSADEDLVFTVTVTNDVGLQDSASVTVRVNNIVITASSVYFAASTDGFSYSLWTSDGTDSGTQQLNSVQVQNSEFSFAKTVAGYTYFRGNDGVNGTELWRSDGTVSGTEMLPVADDSEYSAGASASADPNNFIVNGDRLLLGANTSQVGGINYPEFVSFDASAVSVSTGDMSIVHDDRPSAGFGRNNNALASYNNYVYFMDADFSGPTYSLHRSDGINTSELVVTGLSAADAHDFVEFNGELYFIVGGSDLWKTDGTASSLFKTFTGRAGYSFASDSVFVPFVGGAVSQGGRLYFVADDGDGRELWSTNGVSASAPDTAQILDLDGNSGASSYPFAFRSVNGNVVFMSQNGRAGTDGLWFTDGTAGGTFRLAAISVGDDVGFYSGKTSSEPIVIDVDGTEQLFFIGNDGTNGAELWVSDGTLTGTSMVTDLRPGGLGSEPGILRDGGGFLIFSAQDSDGRAKLWRSDGTASGTSLVRDICPTDCFGNSTFFGFGG